MAATAIIIEMFIIGSFGCIWVALLLCRFSILTNIKTNELSANLNPWGTLLSFIAIGIIYQFG